MRFSFSIIPRYLADWHFCSSIPFIVRVNLHNWELLVLGFMSRYFVFAKFKVNLLAFNHVSIFSIFMYGNMYNNLLVSFISYEARYKEYHHLKLALKSRNFCHTPAYLATLLHSNNAKDEKELMAYIRKKCCKDSCCVNFIIVSKENAFIFKATFSRD